MGQQGQDYTQEVGEHQGIPRWISQFAGRRRGRWNRNGISILSRGNQFYCFERAIGGIRAGGIPEELEAAHFPSRYDRKKNNGQQQQQHNRRASSKRDDSAAVAEIGNNIMDLDNYMLSVFHMNDDASIYTKSTADTSLSSSSSCTSASSTRRRHRGAFRNRMKEARQDDRDDDSVNNRTVTKRNEKGSTWLESMQKSSKTIFVEGKNGWTPTKGWHTTNESRGWDLKPGGSWNDIDPVFDSIKKQRLEI